MEKRGINNIDIDGLENLRPGEGVQVDKDMKFDYGAELSTGGTPIIDDGIGQNVLLRTFTYSINPEKIREFPNDKQKIFNDHAKYLTTLLWGDGLRPFDGASPKVIIDRKKGFYKIIVPCEARNGLIFAEQAKNLTQELANEKKIKDELEKSK